MLQLWRTEKEKLKAYQYVFKINNWFVKIVKNWAKKVKYWRLQQHGLNFWLNCQNSSRFKGLSRCVEASQLNYQSCEKMKEEVQTRRLHQYILNHIIELLQLWRTERRYSSRLKTSIQHVVLKICLQLNCQNCEGLKEDGSVRKWIKAL